MTHDYEQVSPYQQSRWIEGYEQGKKEGTTFGLLVGVIIGALCMIAYYGAYLILRGTF